MSREDEKFPEEPKKKITQRHTVPSAARRALRLAVERKRESEK
jgi:hypothetical protein